MNDYQPANNSGYRYIVVVIDNFSNIGGTVLFQSKFAQLITDEVSRIIKTTKLEPNLIEAYDWTEYNNKKFIDFLKLNDIKKYFRSTSNWAIFAERFNITISISLKKPVFGKGNASWISDLQSIT